MKVIIVLGIFIACYSASQAFDCCNDSKPESIQTMDKQLSDIDEDFNEFENLIDGRIYNEYSNAMEYLQGYLMDFNKKHTKEQCICGKNSESSICQCIQKINDKAVEIYKDHTKTVTLHRNMHLKYLNNETTNKTNLIQQFRDYFNNQFFICQCLLSGSQSLKCYQQTLSKIESVEDLERDLNEFKNYFLSLWIESVRNDFRKIIDSFVKSLEAHETSFDKCTEEPLYPNPEETGPITSTSRTYQPSDVPTNNSPNNSPKDCPQGCPKSCPTHCPNACPKDCDNKHDCSGCQFCIKLQI